MDGPRDFRGIFRDDELARAVYSEAAGIQRIIPAAVAVPADADDVSALVRWAAADGVSLVARGSGSSMAGGAIGRGVIVDLSRLRELTLDPEARRIRVGPGVLRGEVASRARERGLRFPVDPSSGAYCTIGGMAGTNAAGARSLRYGAMRPWVTALDCVFADGTRATIRRGEAPPPAVAPVRRLNEARMTLVGAGDAARHPRVRKESSGYGVADWARSGDLIDLLVGSEGTLALFVGIELALIGVAGATSSLMAAFRSLDAATEGAARARAAGVSACELLDRSFLEIAATGGTRLPVPVETEAVLLAEVEGADAGAAADAAQQLRRAFTAAGAVQVTVALDPGMERMVWGLRKVVSPILARLGPTLTSMQFIEDGAVPPEHLAAYVRGVHTALAARGVRGVVFGHAGDAHIHVNPLIDVHHGGWRDRVRDLLEDVTELTASLGGTLAGEHGDGRVRAPLLPRVWSRTALSAFATVKACFDPDGTLNPGAKISDGAPLGEIKYDPELPPLPPAARTALETVARDKAYDRLRLALLGPTV